jgi:hypothetical protein
MQTSHICSVMLGLGLGLALRPKNHGLGLETPGLGLGLETPGLGLGLETPGLGLGLETPGHKALHIKNKKTILDFFVSSAARTTQNH